MIRPPPRSPLFPYPPLSRSSPPPSPLLQRGPSRAAGGPRTATSAQQFTLKNGMQLIVQPDRRPPTAVHLVWVRVGSVDVVDGTSGVAHSLRPMMFKGSRRGAPGEFSCPGGCVGGRDNAFPS